MTRRQQYFFVIFCILAVLVIDSSFSEPDSLSISVKAPDFSGIDFQGIPFSLSQFRGKVILVNFWASWCVPCRQELPVFARIYKELQPQGLEILAVNIDKDRSKAERFMRQFPLPFPLLSDEKQSIVSFYKPKAMPTSYLIDQEGIIRHILSGFHPKDEAAIRQMISNLLSRTTPEEK